MKKFVYLMLCGALLTGCTKQESPNIDTSKIVDTVESVVDIATVQENVTEAVTEVDSTTAMSPDEALENAKTVLSEGAKMTVNMEGLEVTMALVHDTSKMDIGGVSIYCDNDNMYLVDADGKASKVPVGEYNEENEDGSVTTANVGSVEEVQKGIADMLDGLTNPDSTEDANVFTVEHIEDDTTMSGKILFSNGAFEGITLVNDEATIVILPYRESLADEVASLNAEETDAETVTTIIFSAIFGGMQLDTDEGMKTEIE